ncbi:MAG: glycosyltransferase family 2 protein [Verrucomicrobiaceae bacterium]|nr:MAG: glycosyltransferase family 2 protein [Verrucomicrobiaceae bacterium]
MFPHVFPSLGEPFRLLADLDWPTFLTMFWYMAVVEIPRYTLGFVIIGSVMLLGFRRTRQRTPTQQRKAGRLRVSAIIAGHNEAAAMRKCLVSLNEQTRRFDEIIVIDDGSSDGMRAMLHELRSEGLIDMALSNQVRCGKASSCNLGFEVATGDILVNLDADCSYDRDSIEKLLAPFDDPSVGATCGNIGVRNTTESIAASFQAVEYLVSISLGKRVMDYFNMVICASGAFGAFRKEALDQVGALVVGPGEDLDLTIRLRRAGWGIRFVHDSWCMTDTPASFAALIRQRRRWDRDTLRIRFRKFRDTFSFNNKRFKATETWEQVEFFFLNFLVTMIFPIYIGYLFYTMGTYAWTVLSAVAIVYIVLDLIGFTLAALNCGRYPLKFYLGLLPFVLTFGIYGGLFMRMVRLYAYLEEMILYASYRDSYVPQRVLNVLDRY